MLYVVLAIAHFVLCLVLIFIFKQKLNSKTNTEELKKEAESLINTFNREAEKNIALFDAKALAMHSLLDKAENKVEASISSSTATATATLSKGSSLKKANKPKKIDKNPLMRKAKEEEEDTHTPSLNEDVKPASLKDELQHKVSQLDQKNKSKEEIAKILSLSTKEVDLYLRKNKKNLFAKKKILQSKVI